MKMHFSRSLKMVAVAASMLLTSVSFAVTMVPINLAQIVELSDKAFVGTVASVKVVKTENRWADEITVKVTEPVLGAVQAGDTVTWQQFRTNENIRLPGVPQYQEGGEYLVFLAGKATPRGFQAAVGLGQGSFRVHRNTQTGQALARNEFMNAQLFEGLDTDLVAGAVVDQEPAAKSPSQEPRAQKVKRVGVTLANRQAGASDLPSLVAAAKAMKANPKPSEAFRAAKGAAGAQRATTAGMTVPVTP
jgi:hypothetical protein